MFRLAGGAIVCLLAYGGVHAELISAYFPTGVPGYGTAPGVTVASRLRPEYDNPGTRLGSFLLQPALTEDVGYDSNVFASSSGRRGSWILGTHPSLLLTSDWSRDRLVGWFSADNTAYLDQPSQSRTDWTGSVGGAMDIGRDRLTIGTAHFSLHQDRTDLDALPSDTPIAFHVDDIRVAYTMAFNRLSVTPAFAFSSYRYFETTIAGVSTPQAYRDRDVLQGTVTTRYALAAQRNLVVVLRALGSHYTAPQPGQPTRDSTGYEALVGFEDDSDAVWRYRLLLGWEVRDFAAAQYNAHHAPIAEAQAIWSPTGLTTFTATLTRSIEDAAQEGISGFTYTGARLVLDHEYLRNVLLRASAGLQRADYLQGGGHATGFTLGAGVTWLVNRHVRVGVTYDFTDQRSTASTASQLPGSYTRSLALLSLKLAL